MKRMLIKSLCIFFSFLMLTMQTFAYTISSSNAITQKDVQAVTQFNESEVYTAFADVSALDQYLTLNDGKSFSDVSKVNSSILNGVSATTALPATSGGKDELALGIPSFLWGCVLGWVGMLIVYLVTENKEQTKKALWGCLAGTAIEVAIYVVLIAASASSGTTY